MQQDAVGQPSGPLVDQGQYDPHEHEGWQEGPTDGGAGMGEAEGDGTDEHGGPQWRSVPQQPKEHAAEERFLADGGGDRGHQQRQEQEADSVGTLEEDQAAVARHRSAAVEGPGRYGRDQQDAEVPGKEQKEGEAQVTGGGPAQPEKGERRTQSP